MCMCTWTWKLVVQKHSCENLSHSPELLFSISDKMHQSLDLIGNENFENTLNHPQDFLFLPILVLSLNFVKPLVWFLTSQLNIKFQVSWV